MKKALRIHPLCYQLVPSLLIVAGSLNLAVAVSFGQDTIDAPLPPEQAAREMIVPDGFHVTLFAGEPDVKQPIGFCIDDRGRLWVAEAYNYPNHGTRAGDRIVVFEDVDGDGRFDKRTVFYDKLNYVTGIEVGFGGVWVMSPPSFYFIPDRDGDDRPDTEPKVLLDGFGNHANAHNLANGFAWGPDGWLYGTHGRTNWSMIGKPGTDESRRVRFDGGVYRYHPVRHTWEPFADGTTNPWGIDWDDFGEGFVCNCVNPHLFHVIQGAHYEPWRNRKSSQFAYDRIDTIADHLHFVGKGNVRDGLGSDEEDAAGGGHAHCGTMVYLGDNWPSRYRNTVFMNNIHGRRINNDLLRQVGSGYSASHGPDIMRSADPWFMGVTLAYGPDGAVFVSDWSDTGECHSVRNTRRHTGRIYKISYGDLAPAKVNVAELSNRRLVDAHLHRNDWHVRHARRVLQERAAKGDDMLDTHRWLLGIFLDHADVTRKLRAFWTMHAIGALDDDFLLEQLSHDSEYIRGWAVRLLCEDKAPSAAALATFRKMATEDESPRVRLQLASALQRLRLEQRWPIAEALVARGEDAEDANLPLLAWYAIEPLVSEDTAKFTSLAATAELPQVRQNVARRAAEYSREGLNELVTVLARVGDAQSQIAIMSGAVRGLEGQRSVAMPPAWSAAYSKLTASQDVSVQQQAIRLALIFDDPAALQTLRDQAADDSLDAGRRKWALEALIAKRPRDLAQLLMRLIADADVQSVAIRGLAEYDHVGIAPMLLAKYSTFGPSARQDTMQTLASRSDWASKLLDAVESGQVPVGELTAYTARQLQSLGDPRVVKRLKQLWGEVRATPADKRRIIAGYRKRITRESLADADLSAGRAVFEKTCANCHRLFGNGGQIGPDITGAQRRNLDYVLENLVDPSAAVSKDFQMQLIETTRGRIITGLVVAESDKALTVQTVNEKIVVPLDEVEDRRNSPLSMMPDGLLDKLSLQQVRNLIAYLSNSHQVPLNTSDAAQ